MGGAGVSEANGVPPGGYPYLRLLATLTKNRHSTALWLSTRKQNRPFGAKSLPRRHKIVILCILRVNVAQDTKKESDLSQLDFLVTLLILEV